MGIQPMCRYNFVSTEQQVEKKSIPIHHSGAAALSSNLKGNIEEINF